MELIPWLSEITSRYIDRLGGNLKFVATQKYMTPVYGYLGA